MSDLDQIIQISPLQPTTGPLSRQSGSGVAMQSLAGLGDPRMIAMIASEQINALQDQIDSLRRLLGLAPSIESINFPFLIITDLVLTNNSPSAGNIAWTPCTIYYNGQVYGIAGGNTSAGEKLVWWVVGNSTFSIGNSFTPNATTFTIATNTSGTADVAWNKVGANSIQSSQVIGGLLTGYKIQAASTLSITSATTAGTYTVLSYSGAGGILTLRFNPGNLSVAAGSYTITASIAIDGQSPVVLTVATGSSVAGPNYDPASLVYAYVQQNNGTSGPTLYGFNTTFSSSLSVTLTVAFVGVAAFTGGSAGDIEVGWVTKI